MVSTSEPVKKGSIVKCDEIILIMSAHAWDTAIRRAGGLLSSDFNCFSLWFVSYNSPDLMERPLYCDKKHKSKILLSLWRTFRGTSGTYKVKVPHAPLKDVTLTISLEWQPWLSRYTFVVDTLHGCPYGIPEAGRQSCWEGGTSDQSICGLFYK